MLDDNEPFAGDSPRDELMRDDGRAPLAVIAGLIAALVAGGIWAGLVFVTNVELGFVAWGVGLLVGLAMARVTNRRSQTLAVVAAALAILGLVAGKALIFVGSESRIADEVAESPDILAGMLAWEMYATRELTEPTLIALDAAETAGDTLSDALWDDMHAQASARLEGMTPEERRQLALAASGRLMGSMGLVGGIRAQLSLFDALWLFLAVGTAFQIMAPARRGPAEAAEMSVDV